MWRYVGPMLLLGTTGLAVWVFVTAPLLIDPFAVFSRIEAGTIQQSTLAMMASILPLTMILLFFLMVVIIGLMYAALSIEKKYLKIITEIQNEQSAKLR